MHWAAPWPTACRLRLLSLSIIIASYSGPASAWKFAEGRGATTSLVSKHLARSGKLQAEAGPE